MLFVGADEGFGKAVAGALVRHGMFLETATPEEAVETAVVAAPDLIVLTGVAAVDGGSKLLRELCSRPETSSIPVALVQDEAALDVRLRAFRLGASAILPKKASVDELASKIAELAREIPGRDDENLGELGEVTLEELVKTLGAELRSGILSVGTKDGDGAVRLVLGGGRPLAKLIEEFVEKARSHVVRAEPRRYEFEARAGGTVQLFDAETSPALDSDNVELEGLRVVLADQNTGRADSVAGELRSRGAEVIVSELQPSEMRFAQMRQADPSVLLIGEEHIQGEGYELLRRMRRDTRLRWTALLVVRWDELWTDASSAPVERLASTLVSLTEPERKLRAQAEASTGLDARLEMMGPARTLRALSLGARGYRITVNNPRLWAEMDLANGLWVGALARTVGDDSPRTFEGIEALSALLQLSSGRLQIDPVDNAARANVMSTVDMALSIADGERPPIVPSMPAGPPSQPPAFTAPKAAAPGFEPEVVELGADELSPQEPEPTLGDVPDSVDLLLSGPESSPPAVRAHVQAHARTAADSAPALATPMAAPVAPKSTQSSAIDERLRRLLLVDENGPSPSLLAVLGGLALVELFWILLLVAAVGPSQSTRLEAAPGGSGPIAAQSAEASPQGATPERAKPGE